MRDDSAASRAAYRARTGVVERTARTPLGRILSKASVTKSIIAVSVLVLIGLFITGDPTGGAELLRFGALPPVVPRDEWWRLFTAMFVHIGGLHLLFNAWGLIIFGAALEERYGRGRFLALYLAAGLLGNAFSLAFTEGGIRAGASGGVFGVLGAWLAFFLRHRSVPSLRGQLRSVLFLVAINLFFGTAVRGVDNFAHLGGLMGGFVAGAALEWSARSARGVRRLAWLGGLATTVVAAVVLAVPHMV